MPSSEQERDERRTPGPRPGGSRRSERAVAVYFATIVPVMSWWTSQRKKYVPGASAGTAVAVGDVVTSAKSDLVVPALQPGSYFFRCDVHHDMTGTIVAK
jgi:hypothetical protein